MVRGTAINPSIHTNLIWTQQSDLFNQLSEERTEFRKMVKPRHLLGEIWKIPDFCWLLVPKVCPLDHQPFFDVPSTGRCRWKDLRALWRRGAWTRANGTWPWENGDDNGDIRWENRDLMGLEWGLWKFDKIWWFTLWLFHMAMDNGPLYIHDDNIYIIIWVNFNDASATSLESWLVTGAIPI